MMNSTTVPHFSGRLLVSDYVSPDLNRTQQDTLREHYAQAKQVLAPYDLLMQRMTPDGLVLTYHAEVEDNGQIKRSMTYKIQMGNYSYGNAMDDPLREGGFSPKFYVWLGQTIVKGYNQVLSAAVAAQKSVLDATMTTLETNQQLQRILNVFPDHVDAWNSHFGPEGSGAAQTGNRRSAFTTLSNALS